MMFYKHVSLLMLVALTTACFKATQKSPNLIKENAGTFYLEEVTGTSQVTSVKSWQLPNSKNFSFKTCVKDQNSQEAIRGHQFIILDNQGNTIDKKRTSSDGCLNWTENIKYNYLADAKYIPLTRFIRADGIHTGQKKVSLAINPWKERTKSSVEQEVRDLSFKPVALSQMVAESDATLFLTSVSKKRRLWVDGMIVNMSNLGAAAGKKNAILKLDMAPQLLLTDVNGQTVTTPISNAKFMVKAYLVAVVAEGQNKKRVILGDTFAENPIEMVGERFRADLPLQQLWKSSMGQLEMLLQVTPVDGPEDLAPFEGSFLIGSFKTMAGFVGITPENNNPKFDLSFNMSEYLAQTVKPSQDHPISGIFPLVPFEFSYFQFRLSNVDVEHETPTRRKMHILIESTVKNPIDNGELVRSTVFNIKKVNGTSEPKTTNQDGILSWDDTIEFKTFAPPRYLHKTITISHNSGFTETFTLKINPWAKLGFALGVDQRNSDFPIGIDLRDPEAHTRLDKFEKLNMLLKPQMLMGKYVFSINENTDYKVDKNLTNITPYKSFIVNLAPYLLTYSNPLDGIESSVGLRDGYYLLKVGLETNIFGKRHISTTKKIVILRNGQINEPIRMRISDVRQMKIRNLVYVELHPVDYSKLTFGQGYLKGYRVPKLETQKITKDLESLIDVESGYEPRTFVGIFNPGANKGEGPLRPTDDMDELFTDQTTVSGEEGIDEAEAKNKIKIFDDLVPMDDMKLEYRNDPRMKALLNDPKFREDLKIMSATNINQFLLRMRVDGYKPTTVADLEKDEKALLAQNTKENHERAKLDKFVDFSNADFVTLNNEDLVVDKYFPSIKKKNLKLGSSNMKSNFIQLLNSSNTILGTYNHLYPDKKFAVTESDLRGLLPKIENNKIVKSTGITTSMATRLCNFWFNHYLDHRVLDNKHNAFFTACVTHALEDGGVNEKSSDKIFVLDQKIRVFNTAVHKFLRGYVLRLGVGSGFRVSYGYGVGESSSLSMAWSFAPIGTLLPFRAIHYVSNIAAGFGSTFHNDNQGYDSGYGKSSDVSANSSLNGEEARFLLGINEYERCSIIRLNPDYIAKLNLLERVKGNATLIEKSKLLTRGVMVCTGELERKPLVLQESLFYFTPDPGDSSVLDATDIKNYEWAVSFRGKRDYSAFVQLIKAKGLKLEESSIFKADLKKLLAKALDIDVDQDPINHVSPSVQDVQKPTSGIVTTYPGVYTVP